ncbi:MAG TPA: DUF6519 domain-containing protein [Allosphingosinicella sp.]|jgi:hypothetical protein|nr:DUF6519 domain-containing protein [Allosphingosinicella sp.]
MQGDFSRDTYLPSSRYSRVLMQQGRVQLDSDWNEQTSILLGYMRALTRDLFGSGAGPANACGFRIVTIENRGSLTAEVKAEVDAALAEEKVELDENDMLILAGRYYVAGLPVEATKAVRYRAQAGFPFGEGNVENLLKRSWIAYLDVWEEFVSADQDPYIRETALNGVDTCGRAQVRWRVRLLPDPNPDDQDPIAKLPPTGSGRIKVRANPPEDPDTLCTIEPDARYRGAENQLYRVEIHAGGKADATPGATFKWSRDNSSITFRIVSGTGQRVTLAGLGRDEATTLVEGDWVELVDDLAIATAGVGLLAQVANVDLDGLRVELAAPDGQAVPTYTTEEANARHAFLRRWDHRVDPKKAGGAIPVVEGAAHEIELEDGIKVTFEEGGTYRAGDYWMIPARVATGDVEWPGEPKTPEFQLPHGPAHYYAPLAMRGHRGTKPAEFVDRRCCIARLPCVVEARSTGPATGSPTVTATVTTPDKK